MSVTQRKDPEELCNSHDQCRAARITPWGRRDYPSKDRLFCESVARVLPYFLEDMSSLCHWPESTSWPLNKDTCCKVPRLWPTIDQCDLSNVSCELRTIAEGLHNSAWSISAYLVQTLAVCSWGLLLRYKETIPAPCWGEHTNCTL